MVIAQTSAEARPTGDRAICPVVIRRTDVPDALATDARVKPLDHVVLDEFLAVPNAPKASTLRKSQAQSLSQWLFMNRFHVRFFSRSGAGAIPSSSRMLATVVRPISIFNPVRRASRSFVYPQRRKCGVPHFEG
jgi:hypothetical protein